MADPKAGNLQPANTCSVCLEMVNDTSERSMAKLICGHQFHLDCIGSAFNAKGSMQCPNCRQIENGQWLYGNGRLHLENSISEDMMFEEEYDVEYDMFARVSELLFPEDLMIGHNPWCPYQGSYTQLSLSLGNGDHRPIAHAEVVVNMVVGENLESSESVQPCPFVLAQAPALHRHVPGGVENVRAQESSAHLRHGGPHRQRFTPSSGQWDHQSAVFAPIGVVGGIDIQEGSRWPQSDNQSAGHIPPSQSRHHGRRRRSSASTPSVANVPASQFAPRPASWDYLGTSAVQNAAREVEPRNNANFRQRRREGASTFWQHAPEPEGQRWAPPPLSGLYGTHGILDSELPAQVGRHVPQAFHRYPSVEDIDVQPSTSFYHPR